MEILYYPSMYVESELTLKQLLLMWGKVSTIVPLSEKTAIDAYYHGTLALDEPHALDVYKSVNDLFGSSVVDFAVINDKERELTSLEMFEIIAHWNKDTGFYDSLKLPKHFFIKPRDLGVLISDKLDMPLLQLLVEEQLVRVTQERDLLGRQQIVNSYIAIMAEVMKESRGLRLVTNDQYVIAAKSGVSLKKASLTEENYELVSLAIPQVFLEKKFLDRLTWKDIAKIREDLLPLSQGFYQEVEDYQSRINNLTSNGDDNAAFDLFAEFCERVVVSFRALSLERDKLRKFVGNADTVGMVSGFLFPSIKLIHPDPVLGTICDFGSIATTAGMYGFKKNKKAQGFDYLENMNRRLNLAHFKGMVSCLIPKGLRV